jgi:hypothetical protein
MAVAEEFEDPVNINQDVALFRLKEGLPAYYLAAFLNSRVGKAFVEQYSTGQINPFLGLGNLRMIPVPIYRKSRIDQIADKTQETVQAARAAHDESRRGGDSRLIIKRAYPLSENQEAAEIGDAGWDFVGETANGTEDIWWILEGKDYPRLWWEAK